MVSVRPATQFCCGCSLEFGVNLILVAHLVQSVVTIAMVSASIIFDMPGMLFTFSLWKQCALAAVSLGGLPLILAALWAMRRRYEVPIRLYWWYMAFWFLIDTIYVFREFIWSGPCENVSALFDKNSQSFACGVNRMLNPSIVIMATLIQGYLLFIVFSHCEDLRESGGGPDLADLAEYSKQRQSKKYTSETDTYGILGQYIHDHVPQEGDRSIYNSAGDAGYGTGRTIFGRQHEMAFPPPARC